MNMDRAQFMEQLKKLLSDISEAERLEALDYYENYFDDAGPENEAAVIRELGSPGKVAAIIKADLKESNDGYAEYTERGYEDSRNREHTQVPDKYTAMTGGKASQTGQNGAAEDKAETYEYGTEGTGDSQNGPEGFNNSRRYGRSRGTQRRYTGDTQGSGETYDRTASRAGRGYHAEKKRNSAGIILVLILLVFLSPFIKGAVGGLVGVVVTIALLPFLLVFGLGAAALGLIIGAGACIGAGIGLCFSFAGAGILTIGIGCLLMALGILFCLAIGGIAGRLLPWFLRKITDFCYNLLHRRGKEGEMG